MGVFGGEQLNEKQYLVPRVPIRTDSDALDGITFGAAERYLQEAGWRLTDTFRGGEVLVYRAPLGGREGVVRVSRNETYVDRADRIGDVITVVANVEERSEVLVFWDLVRGGRLPDGDSVVPVPRSLLAECRAIMEADLSDYVDCTDCGDEHDHTDDIARRRRAIDRLSEGLEETANEPAN